MRGYSLFAHCFTCSKDAIAGRLIAEKLTSRGIAVLRFDFTGLGSSEGDFENASFSSNVEDLVRAAHYLRGHFAAPALLIGHSLGGAAVLAAAGRVPEAKAAVTISAPLNVAHVLRHFPTDFEEIERHGKAEVTLAGRTFTVSKQFVDGAKGQGLQDRIAGLRKALLVMHAPPDQIVGIEHATAIFRAAKHPKSFVSLDDADHLLLNRREAAYVVEVIAAWASRYLRAEEERLDATNDDILVSETGAGKFQNAVIVGSHHLLADEPIIKYGSTSSACQNLAISSSLK